MKSTQIAGARVIGGFRILHRNVKYVHRQILMAAQKYAVSRVRVNKM